MVFNFSRINLIELDNSQVILSACDADQPIYEFANSYSGLITSFIEAGAKMLHIRSGILIQNQQKFL